MLSVGETLKRARLEKGLDIGTVAERTKISPKYLEAIESDDRKALPSAFFYKSFVEQYAAALSLDTKDIGAKLDRVLSVDEPLPLPGFESVVARNVPPIKSTYRFQTRASSRSVIVLVLVVLGCSGVYVWWRGGHQISNFKKMLELARVSANLHPAAPAKPAAPPAKAEQAPAPAAQSNSGQPPQASQSRESAPVTVAPAPAPVEAASNAKSEPTSEPPAAIPAQNSDYKVMLALMAHEATWLSLSADGKPVFSGIMQPNETRTVESKQFAKMRVGNAAGIEVRLNGKLLAPLGARGQVLVVLFTPDNFQIVSPPKESD